MAKCIKKIDNCSSIQIFGQVNFVSLAEGNLGKGKKRLRATMKNV